jgi:topoisomerase-4 subunit A
MPKTVTPPPPGGLILDAPFDSALSERYLVYALSTITARSLPDARDGLKPVHRRLLWAMRLLRLDPASAPKKCARVVGDVIGKYHPHGDQSVYDAMVRLAQDFALRFPLVEGQGNFGNIDGDNAAAMRYTEARLTQAAILLMEGVDDATVGFRPTYNGEEEEPEVFPAAFPNLLANGASGIAVGMATSVPPHNVAEIAAAATLLLDDPEAPDATLMAAMPGPDFPTGGVLVDPPAVIAQAYATGRGSLRLRASWSREDTGRGTWVAVVDGVPYGVPKSRLIEQIAALIEERKLPILADVRDESDAVVRVVLEPRSRTVDADALMEALFRLTDLEVRVPVNLNVLDEGRTPVVMPLRGLLNAWIRHRHDVQLRAASHRLGVIAERLEVLGGYLVAYLNLDEVIRIIREEDEPKAALMRRFDLTATQAEAILNMRLRALRRLEEIAIRREEASLTAESAKLQALIDSPAKQRAALKKQFAELAKTYGADTPLGTRRTRFAEAAAAAPLSRTAMIEREPLTVLVSQKGWVRALKGHADDAALAAQKHKDGDGPAWVVRCETTDRLALVTAGGRAFTLDADRLPGGRGFGEPLSLTLDLAGEPIAALDVWREGARWLLLASDGRGFVAPADALLAETRRGRQVMTPREGAKLAIARALPDDADHLALVGENRKLLVTPISELPTMTRGQGVQVQKYRDGGMADAKPMRLADGLSWPMGGNGGRVRTEADLRAWVGPRGASGRTVPTGFPRDNRFG